eukprot:m.821780 g.821780  ORF g.821780 m.821780 type:complete len:91 (+) comp59396_c0_seq10:695-967(+)
MSSSMLLVCFRCSGASGFPDVPGGYANSNASTAFATTMPTLSTQNLQTVSSAKPSSIRRSGRALNFFVCLLSIRLFRIPSTSVSRIFRYS